MSHSPIAIIGTAGRQDDAPRISLALYDEMYARTVETISEWKCKSAVSGGAAVSDHLAVRAYLDGHVTELLLYLPAPFVDGRFVPTPHVRFNPGRTIQNYHEDFSRRCGLDSIGELVAAIDKGAQSTVIEGFHNRNLEVAQAARSVLAFTFGRGPSGDFDAQDAGFTKAAAAGLKDGGTAHTWQQAWNVERKRHVNLFNMTIRSAA